MGGLLIEIAIDPPRLPGYIRGNWPALKAHQKGARLNSDESHADRICKLFLPRHGRRGCNRAKKNVDCDSSHLSDPVALSILPQSFGAAEQRFSRLIRPQNL